MEIGQRTRADDWYPLVFNPLAPQSCGYKEAKGKDIRVRSQKVQG